MSEQLILGVDPGSVHGGVVVVYMRDGRPRRVQLSLGPRPEMRELVRWVRLGSPFSGGVVVELLQGGRLTSTDVLDTAIWTGRLVEAALAAGNVVRGYHRSRVKATLLGRVTANDRAVRAWLCDAWSQHPQAQRAAREPAVGTKRVPGPLWGVTRDAWSALAVVHASLMCDPSVVWR